MRYGMRSKTIKIFVLVVLYTFVMYSQGFISDVSKRGTSAATFLSIGQSARAIGMGSAFVGIQNDPANLYWNPAGIASIEGISLLFDHTNWIADVGYNFLGATTPASLNVISCPGHDPVYQHVRDLFAPWHPVHRLLTLLTGPADNSWTLPPGYWRSGLKGTQAH